MPQVCPRIRLDDATIRRLEAPSEGRLEVRDALVPSLTLRVYADGRRVWTARVRLKGGRSAPFRRLTLGEWLPQGRGMGVAQAREKARDAWIDARAGQDPQRPRVREARAGTIRALAERYLRDQHQVLRFNSYRQYEANLRLHLLPALGDLRPSALTRARARALLASVAQESPVQANRCHAVLSRLYAWAAERELVLANPLAGMRRPHREISRDRVYSRDELAAIIRAAEAVRRRSIGAAILWILGTAARATEALGARVEEVDLGAKVWRIPAERSKTRRGRVIPLAPGMVELARARVAAARDGYLFPATTRLRELGWESPRCVRPLRAASGVADLRLHDLRRSVATGLAELGTPATVVAAILGHAQPVSAATAVYLRYGYEAEARAALEAWEKMLASI